MVDPEIEDFTKNIELLGELTGEDTFRWHGYLAAHRNRRQFFKRYGATSSDHGHATARTESLSQNAAAKLFAKPGAARQHLAHGEALFDGAGLRGLDDL